MCGFVGFLSANIAPDLDIGSWSESVRHRGPDQSGVYHEQPFGIGTRRLSIQDLSSAGDQPMVGERWVIGFNGEIYNHLDLRAEIAQVSRIEFRSHSDTETILRAVEAWGVSETLSRLNGMYALATYDRQSGELSLARDPLGIKPIFYTRTDAGVFFGSESKALRTFTDGKLSRNGVALYLYFGFIPAPHSLLEGVNKVRPGELIVFTQSGEHKEQILPRAWTRTQQLMPTSEGRLHQLRAEVEQAIDRQLMSDVPVGIFLSGGVDSTIIAGVASRLNPGMASFSLNPTTTSQDPEAQSDARLAGTVAAQFGLEHHEIGFDPFDVIDHLDELLDLIDEPVAELYSLGELALSRAAREAGIKAVLTGHGGDEVFLGYPTYQAVFRGDLYNRIPFFGPAARLVAGSTMLSDSARTNLLGAAKIWRQPVLDRYTTISGVHFSLDEAAMLAGITANEAQEMVSQILNDTALSVSLLPRAGGDCNAELFSRMDMLLMVPEHYNTRLDRMTMRGSVEARVPFQDLELIGFVSRLSHHDLLHGGLKGMLRRAFEDTIPAEIANRPKQTFQAPMLSWVAGPMAPWIEDQLSRVPDWMPRSSVMNGHRPATTRQAYRVWSLALLEGWRHALQLDY